MSIRSAAKAIIIKDDQILLNRCRHKDGSIYYDLPGGGQHKYESLEAAVLREVKEESGFDVTIRRFAALAEEIYTNEKLRAQYPDYTHRILHIFLAEVTGTHQDAPTEKDYGMEESEWIPVDQIPLLSEIRPQGLQQALPQILTSEAPVYLGTEFLAWEQD